MYKSVKEIADELGLSTATVSRALRGDAHVTEVTRERVLACAGDSRPRKRRTSVETRSGMTAMIITAKLTNPIILGFIDGLRGELQNVGIRTVITLTDYITEAECDAVAYAEANGYCGIFLLNAIENPQLLKLLRTVKVPVVLVNRVLRGMQTDVVAIDNYLCGYLAVRYLQKKGHRIIGHIAGPETSITCRDRTRGYLDAMAESGIDGRPYVFTGDRTWEAGAAYAAELLKMPGNKRPTAVFSTTGLMAAGMVAALRGEGFRVPEQLSVIINDDYSKSYMPYPIDFTCYGQDPTLMGKTAAQLLEKRITDGKPDAERVPDRVILEPMLTEYSSVLTR